MTRGPGQVSSHIIKRQILKFKEGVELGNRVCHPGVKEFLPDVVRSLVSYSFSTFLGPFETNKALCSTSFTTNCKSSRRVSTSVTCLRWRDCALSPEIELEWPRTAALRPLPLAPSALWRRTKINMAANRSRPGRPVPAPGARRASSFSASPASQKFPQQPPNQAHTRPAGAIGH